jgi:hypothetical protein
LSFFWKNGSHSEIEILGCDKLTPVALEPLRQCIVSHDSHSGTTHQSGTDTCLMAEVHYHSNSQDGILEKLRCEIDVGRTCGFTVSPEVCSGANVSTIRIGYPAYKLQVKTKGRAHAYVPPCAPQPRNLTPCLGRAPVLPCVPWLWTPPIYLGGLRRCHVSCGSVPRLTIQVGSSAAMRPSAPDPASPTRKASTLTRVPWLLVGHGP